MNRKPNNFKRHFRIYFKNNHPAYIVDEEGNMYVFHRVTHSKTSGDKKNIEKVNPLMGTNTSAMYIVKKEQRDKKNRFSSFKLEIKNGFDISYPGIKKVGSQSDSGSHQVHDRSRYEFSTNIKSKQKPKNNRNIKK